LINGVQSKDHHELRGWVPGLNPASATATGTFRIPVGLYLAVVRRIRDDIDRPVRGLLDDLATRHAT
jgi:hypothetical protein